MKMVHRTSVDKLIHGEIRGERKNGMKLKKFAPFFIPDLHKRICESGLSGQRHGSNVSDVDEMQALLTEDYTLRMSEGARRSRSPQMDIAIMPLTVQEKRTISR
jgi:hypothetical protein